jgi:hypothetical protein
MKALVTLTLAFTFSSLAMAGEIPGTFDNTTPAKGRYTQVEKNPVLKTEKSPEKEFARLYRFKHSKVLKELTFTTKRNSAKLA